MAQAGYHLTILDRGQGHADRMGTVEITDGKFRFRLIKGEPLSPELQSRIDLRLAQFQNALSAE